MIAPPPVLPEEPAKVTPHGGFRRGKSQQWLRYPINPHAASTWRRLETWHGIGLNLRASPRPYLRARGGATPLRDSP